ncbi:glycosyltransferase, partial [candidate division KSB3 bacterium]|nr:glycosyltransferase [candidate division KSB3 bacterium]MBD3323853.1 glycosyltransferase [candidate division KSB3 bacterium]
KGIEEQKIHLLPNWAPCVIRPIAAEANTFCHDHSLHGKFVIMYSGNMGVVHELRTILDVAKQLAYLQDLQFVFIGGGIRRKEVEQCLAAGATNLLLLDYQPLEGLSASLSAATLHFISLRQGFEGLVVPSKFYGVLAAGRPVLYEGEASGEIAQVIHEARAGAVIEPGNTEQLADSILHYYYNRQAVDSDGKNGYQAYLQRFHQAIAAQKYVHSVLSHIPKQ